MATVAIANTDAVLSGATVLLAGSAATITALHTHATQIALGTGGAEDIKFTFDGNAQDFYLGLDDSADELIAGLGTAVGTTPVWKLDTGQGFSLAAALRLDADATISPTIAAQADDWAPTGLATAVWIRVTLTGAQTITGIAAQPHGTILLISNIEGDGGDILTLADQDANSTAVNRFDGVNAADTTVNPGDSIWVIYDGTATRWRPISL